VISSVSKALRKQLAKRTKSLATIVHVVSGIDTDSLDTEKLAKQLKPTKTNGKKGILSFTSTSLTRLYQNTGGSIACNSEVSMHQQDNGNLEIMRLYYSIVFIYYSFNIL
jgi:hypothetical protein